MLRGHVWKTIAIVVGGALVSHCGADDPRATSNTTSPSTEGSAAPVLPAPSAEAVVSETESEGGPGADGASAEGTPMVQGIAPGTPAEEPPAAGGSSPAMPPEAMPPEVTLPEPSSGPAPPRRFDGPFILGADISGVQESIDGGAVFIDTDGVQKSLLDVLKNHGFNFIRLRTFVDPTAPFGYSAAGNGCQGKAEAYNDRDHTAEVAREVKAAGLGLLLDFHYSDNWADPDKQVIPEAWRNAPSVTELAAQLQAYTVDVLETMVAAGGRPDIVQVGNEITPGMVIHVPTANTDCYGNASVVRSGTNGSAANWDNLAPLLRAGVAGVRQVDETMLVMLHIENTENPPGVIDWVENARQRGVAFDVLGLSAYEQFQGPSTAWPGTLQTLAARFPDLSFSIVEFNPFRRMLNDIMREVPEQRGLGTFFWEPTLSGVWGRSMFDQQGNRFTARANDFAEYDQMRQDYGL